MNKNDGDKKEDILTVISEQRDTINLLLSTLKTFSDFSKHLAETQKTIYEAIFEKLEVRCIEEDSDDVKH